MQLAPASYPVTGLTGRDPVSRQCYKAPFPLQTRIDMDSTSSAAWYAQLARPFFAPPAWVFGPVWSVLYVVIAISFGFVLVQTLRGRMPFAVLLPFILNLLFNAAYTPIQFGLRNNLLASIDILLVLGTLVWAMRAIWGRARWVALVNIPYLLWVGFATVLQLSITWLNR
ncbi:TspO/MBR family protein [Polaromonas sp.]|uniref:TspO/MBR family protein n=1 Tax=Polaromonas sp. TaxID=1869339 RepID=UPI0025DCDF7F|nr:TspO/MBR family protein [Polaromonas sp.]